MSNQKASAMVIFEEKIVAYSVQPEPIKFLHYDKEQIFLQVHLFLFVLLYCNQLPI